MRQKSMHCQRPLLTPDRPRLPTIQHQPTNLLDIYRQPQPSVQSNSDPSSLVPTDTKKEIKCSTIVRFAPHSFLMKRIDERTSPMRRKVKGK